MALLDISSSDKHLQTLFVCFIVFVQIYTIYGEVISTAKCSKATFPDNNGTQRKAPLCHVQIEDHQLKSSDCSNNTLRVYLYMHNSPKIIRINCTATYMMNVVPTFEEGIPWANNTRITFQRFASNISDISTFKYGVQIFPDSAKHYTVQYDIMNSPGQQFHLRTSILIFYSNRQQNSPRLSCMSGSNEERFNETKNQVIFYRIHFLESAEPSIVHLPCITDSTDEKIISKIPHMYIRDVPHRLTSFANNSFVYDKSIGYRINLTSFPVEIIKNRTVDERMLFSCYLDEQQFCWFEDYLELEARKDTARINAWLRRATGQVAVKIKKELNVKIELALNGTAYCSSEFPVLIHSNLTLWRTMPPTKIEFSQDMANSIKSNFSSEAQHIARIQLPQNKIFSWGLGTIECREQATQIVINTTPFLATNEDSPDSTLRYKVLDGTTKTDKEIFCLLNNEDNVMLQSISCSNPIQCQLIHPCLSKGGADICGERIIYHPDCDFIPPNEWNSVKELSRFTNSMRLNGCKAAKVSQSVFKCSSDTSTLPRQKIFIGFDGKPYSNFMNRTIPKAAFIRIIALDTEKNYYTSGKFKFSCQVHAFMAMANLIWYFEYKNGSRVPVPREHVEDIQTKESILGNPRRISNVKFTDTDLTKLICYAPSWQTKYDWINASFDLDIRKSSPPVIITKTNTLELNINSEPSENVQSLTCRVSSFPPAKFEWFHNEIVVSQNSVKEVSDVESRLEFFNVTGDMLGEYKCVATNVAGQDSYEYSVSEMKDNTVFITVSIFTVFLSSVAIFLLYKKYKKRKLTHSLVLAMEEFRNGKSNGDAAEEIPYDQERFELHTDQIKIDYNTTLGEGQFGKVVLGEIKSGDDSTWTTVALKIPKPGSSFETFLDYIKEIKNLLYILPYNHPNIIKLVRAHTAKLSKGKIIIAMEYCEKGSLDKYLQKIAKEGNITPSEFEQTSLAQQFLKIGCGIASGMELLASLALLHGDLAARNILLTTDLVPKITDFGLSRRLYKEIIYKKNFNKKPTTTIPMIWMAPESCESGHFSVKSDVWSFGILLWEMYTLGATPFAALANYDIQDFAKFLKSGEYALRPKPKYASKKIKCLIKECKNIEPDARPCFAKIRERLNDLIHIDDGLNAVTSD